MYHFRDHCPWIRRQLIGLSYENGTSTGIGRSRKDEDICRQRKKASIHDAINVSVFAATVIKSRGMRAELP
jgi:hypothetical protein